MYGFKLPKDFLIGTANSAFQSEGAWDRDGKTETAVSLLDYNGRVDEVSRILGGISVTDSQRAAAIDMLKERETYKN